MRAKLKDIYADARHLARARRRVRRGDPLDSAENVRARHPRRDGGVRRREGGRDPRRARPRGAAAHGPDRPVRRPHRRAVRPRRHGRRALHAEAAPPRRRQDPRAQHRALQPGHPAAARRQGAVRRPAPRRDGGVGARGLRRRLRAAGVPDREVRRRAGPHAHLRVDREGRVRARARACRRASTCSSRSSRRSVSTSSSSKTRAS